MSVNSINILFYGNETTGKIGQCQEIGNMGDLRAKKKKKKERERDTHTERENRETKGCLVAGQSDFSFFSFFFFLAYPWNMEVPRPEIESQPEP